MGYVRAATGVSTATIEMKVPNKPNASAPYNRVIIGEKAMVIACAIIEPEDAIITLRLNGLLNILRNIFLNLI